MAVYVDNADKPFRGMAMCHMTADTDKEMHYMAHSIGIPARHFQGKARMPHYDLSKSMRDRAIRMGAVQVTTREMITILRQRKVD